jgi:hypothetical protein
MKRPFLIGPLAVLLSLLAARAASPPPMVSIINPAPGTQAAPSVVSNSPTAGGFKVQVQVHNDVQDITEVSIGVCPGADDPSTCSWSWSPLTLNTNYDCGEGCGIYEALLGLQEGDWWLQARAVSSADGTGYSSDQRTGNDARYIYLRVRAAKRGTGSLLVRDRSSRMCMDCHQGEILTHSSQSTDTSYGNWQTVCLECHTPHNTFNIYLIRNAIQTPNSGLKEVVFYNTTGDAPQSYVDSSAGSATKGVCQVCHTQTGGAEARWRNTGDESNHYGGSSPTQRCTNCHTHELGFAGGESTGGQSCSSCHADLWGMMHSGIANMVYKHYLASDAATYLVNSTLPHVLGSQDDTDRNCLMCHADHDIFRPDINPEGQRAANLRSTLSEAPDAGADTGFANTDFLASTGGICLSCHRARQQKALSSPNGLGQVQPIPYSDEANPSESPPDAALVVNASAHGYEVASGGFGDGSTFRAVCTKCHNDTVGGEAGAKSSVAAQAAEPRFGLHQSSRAGLLAPDGEANAGEYLQGSITAVAGTTVTVDEDLTKDYTGYALVVISAATYESQRALITATDTANETFTVAFWPLYEPNVGDTFETTPEHTASQGLCYSCHSQGSNSGGTGLDAPNSYKPYDGVDIYNTVAMRNPMEQILNLFGYSYSHPLDEEGRHRPDEPATAPSSAPAGLSEAWNVGDMGTCDAAADQTTCQDSTKAWPNTDQFVGLSITFYTGDCSGQSFSITASSTDTVSFDTGGACTPAVGDSYYIGTRHVSCSDCHNTHAAQVNPMGTVSGGTTTTVQDGTKTFEKTGWANDRWKNYLMVFTDSNGVRRVRPITGSSTDSTGTTYTLAIPLPAAPSGGESYRVLKLDGSGAEKGVWGVQLSGYSSAGQEPSTLTYAKKYSRTKQYEQCLRCHSYYGYYTAPPSTPSGGPDGSAAAQTDLAKEINPQNYAHHAIYAVGRNQPIVPDGSTAPVVSDYWPVQSNTISSYDSGTGVATLGSSLPDTALPGWYVIDTGANVAYQIVEILGPTQIRIAATNGNPWDANATYPASIGSNVDITAGLGNTFVPPYGPWAVIRCSDCHRSAETDPLGPHASVNRWLLKSLDTALKFEFWDGSSVVEPAPNSGADTAIWCFNCHRRDVYGDGNNYDVDSEVPYRIYSRVPHSGTTKHPDGTGMKGMFVDDPNIVDPKNATVWPEICRHCHLGYRLGGSHGTWLVDPDPGDGNSSELGEQGRRFLNGATWDAYDAPTTGSTITCYTIGSATSVSSCTHHDDRGASGDTKATYDYTGIY